MPAYEEMLVTEREISDGVTGRKHTQICAIVSTTGMISRELFEHRTQMKQGHEKEFSHCRFHGACFSNSSRYSIGKDRP